MYMYGYAQPALLWEHSGLLITIFLNLSISHNRSQLLCWKCIETHVEEACKSVQQALASLLCKGATCLQLCLHRAWFCSYTWWTRMPSTTWNGGVGMHILHTWKWNLILCRCYFNCIAHFCFGKVWHDRQNLMWQNSCMWLNRLCS